jgi:hypothetical protein
MDPSHTTAKSMVFFHFLFHVSSELRHGAQCCKDTVRKVLVALGLGCAFFTEALAEKNNQRFVLSEI